MNRIKLSPLASAPKSQSQAGKAEPDASSKSSTLFSFDKHSTVSDQETSLFAPLNYEKNYAYPLVVWLHANGQKSAQLQTVMPEISMRNYVGVAPQAPVGNFECGYFWEQDYDAVHAADELIHDAVERACSRFNVAPNRIFLAGLGGGGTMALRIAMQYPEKFAGVMSLNGPLPNNRTPMTRWQDARQMPVFWSHHLGNESGEDSVDSMCQQFRQLYSFGYLNLTAREYPTQELLESMAPAAINSWIMEQIQTAIV
jgi:phospholipase/carboxylesterase